jgi:hypothetical protein
MQKTSSTFHPCTELCCCHSITRNGFATGTRTRAPREGHRNDATEHVTDASILDEVQLYSNHTIVSIQKRIAAPKSSTIALLL